MTRHPSQLALAIAFAAVLGAPAIGAAQPRHAHAHARGDAHAHHVVHHHRRAGHDEVIRVAPPAPRVVAIPPRPFPGAVWTAGYWRWDGGAYVWVEGAWVRPVPGRRWTPWRWEQRGGAWFLVPGGWVPSHEGPL